MNKKRKVIILCGALVVGSLWLPRVVPQVQSAFDRGYEHIKILVDIIGIIKAHYVKEKETKDLVYGAASGMVRTLDPFSQFMEPRIHKEMQIETEGKFGGLGIRIALRDGWLTIITPLPGTPAYRLGLMPDDKIVEIEGETTQDITLEDAVKKLRGKPGTKVKITVARKDAKEPLEFEVTREWINIESVVSKMINDDIGYVHIIEFSKKTSDDVDKQLAALKEKGMKSLILDLRNNPGGLLISAVDVSKTFLGSKKLIVYTQGRNPKDRKDYSAGNGSPYSEMPLAILVNRGSASGSEIVAGALQDHKRAIIMGSETFGKGSVQSVIPLSDGSGLRLTTALYYTPAGRSIHRDKETKKGGITPDVVIEVDHKTEIKLRTQNELVYMKDKKPSSKINKDEMVEDVVLNRATEMLQATMIFDSYKTEK